MHAVTDLIPRIADRIDVADQPPPEPLRPVDGGCWLWTGGTFRNGYGSVWLDGRNLLVHRVVYMALVGHIPRSRPHLDHVCRVRACCNPAHLEPVTIEENNLRARRPACPQGHLLEGENVYRRPDSPTSRGCRTCRAAATARYRARKATT